MTKLRKADHALLLALACGLSAEQAARQSGVSVKTAYRRLADPAFAARLGDLRADLLARRPCSRRRSRFARAHLLKPANAPATRLNAARAVLEHGVKRRALVEVEARLRDLEARVAQSPADAGRGPDGGYA